MFDTNVFNRLADGALTLPQPNNLCVIATHIQKDELERTRDQDRRVKLLEFFEFVAPAIEPTGAMVWGASRWGQAKWGDGTTYGKVFKEIENNDRRHGKKRRAQSIMRDALIVVTALKLKSVVVSDDVSVQEAVNSFGGNSISTVQLAETLLQRGKD